MMLNTADDPCFRAISHATCRALREAEIMLPCDVVRAIQDAKERETHETAKAELGNILLNISRAAELGVPVCQDTGVPVIYVNLPCDVPYHPAILVAITEGVRLATRTIPLRPNVVSPIERLNSGDNTGSGIPAIHFRPGDRFTITVLPKGAGAENMSRIAMLLPTQRSEITKFIVETMLIAGGKPCPPVVLGVGIGGTFDGAATLAKEALLKPIDEMTSFEQEICDAVNDLGIGPMGLGGNATALAVKVNIAGCHTASLPVAVNVQCWACRRATVEVVW